MIESPAASERRLALRREIEIPVWVEALPRQPGHPALVRALTRDVSHKGAFLWMPPVFPVGQKLRLEMEVAPQPGQALELKIDCSAEVVRVQPATENGGKSGIAVRIVRFSVPVPAYASPD